MELQYIVLIVILLILIALGLVYYFFYYTSGNNLSKYKIDILKDETFFGPEFFQSFNTNLLVKDRTSLLVPNMGYGITFAWEMNIPNNAGNDKWKSSYNTLKPIISLGDSPVISYHPKKNYLSVILKYKNNPFYVQIAEIRFDNIKIQNWYKYIVIIDNRSVKLYINGVLSATKFLPSIPMINDLNTELDLGAKDNNFMGKVRNIVIYPYPISYNEIEMV